jgi:DNA-binding transcriptional ArsR family regulator
MPSPQNNYIIRDKRQMRALAASTRQEIVDVLPRLGTLSVAELAAALGRPADSLYYHLRLLKRVGLVLSAGTRRVNGRSEALFRAVAADLSLSYKLGKHGNADQINPIVASMLRLGIRDFRRSFRAGKAAVSGPDRELWALRKTGWLSRNQIAEVNQHIHKLMELTGSAGSGEKLYALTVLLTPLERKDKDKERMSRS